MRVSLLNLNLVSQDAIGRSLMDKVRLFRERGDEVRVFVQSPPEGRVPEEIESLCVTCSLAQLLGRGPELADAREHFLLSDIYIYDYPNWYELVESIRGVDRGVVIFDYHGVTPPELWGSLEALDMLKRSINDLPGLLGQADFAVAHSEFTHKELIERYGFPKERAFAFPYAVPLGDFCPGEPDPELIRRYGLEGKRVLLYVGRMAGNKRVDLLVRALPLVKQERPETVLLLVGDNASTAYQPIVDEIKRLSRELGVEKDVVFAGRVDDLPKYYQLADVYVTSSMHEGFCVPLVEAMASGLPVVGSACTAIPHTLGDAGLTFQPEDAGDLASKILAIMRDRPLREQLCQLGLQRAPSFSWEAFRDNWNKTLEAALAQLPVLTEVNAPLPPVEAVSEIIAPAPAMTPKLILPQPEPAAVQPIQAARTPMSAQPAPAAPMPTMPDAEAHYRELETMGDVSMHGYAVRSDKPVVGSFIVWVRRNLTSHLKEPYVDPIIDRQVHVNRRLVWDLKSLYNRLRDLATGWQQQWTTLNQRVDARLSETAGRLQERLAERDQRWQELLAERDQQWQRQLAARDQQWQERLAELDRQLQHYLAEAKQEKDMHRVEREIWERRMFEAQPERDSYLSEANALWQDRLQELNREWEERLNQTREQYLADQSALKQEFLQVQFAQLAADTETALQVTRDMEAQVRSVESHFVQQTQISQEIARQDLDQQMSVIQGLSLRVDELGRLEEDIRRREEIIVQHFAALQRLLEESPETIRRDVLALRAALDELSAKEKDKIDKLYAILAQPSAVGPGFNYFLQADTVGGGQEALRMLYGPLVERFREASQVVDLGCGTGVFLELLRDAGIKAYGIDEDEDSVIFGRKRGLDTRKEEIFAHLGALPDKSVGGIFAAHVIEHLPTPRLWEFMQLCYRKLFYGAPLVLITPNASSLSIFYYTFYKDLTHHKPLHPEAVSFLLSANGFRHIELSTLSPMPDFLKLDSLDEKAATNEVERACMQALNQNLAKLNQTLFGDQDCVASAIK
jgi:glycosyltransferase involved in cell wall biosynthesis/2-polyprenyl-3-methyl-5-hydroxy-6-metoxy-1,4-benzoquinol methylase